MTATTATPTTCQQALNLARNGCAVFPVKTGGKQPDGVRWRDASTTDQDRIAAWLDGTGRNYGIDLAKSGLLVADEDTSGDLDRLLADYAANLPDTFTVVTGREDGGKHLFFRNPDGLGNSGTLKKLGYDIDVKGAGGYVVGPGSVHPSGAVYAVETEGAPAPLPEWLAGIMTTDLDAPEVLRAATPAPVDLADVGDSYVRATVAGALADLDTLAELPEGARSARGHGWDSGTYAAACQLVRAANSGAGYTLAAAEADFRAHCPTDHGFTAQHVAHKWQDALREAGGSRLTPRDGDYRGTDLRSEFDLPTGHTAPPEAEAGQSAEDAPDDRTTFDLDVAREVARMQVRAEAQRIIAARDSRDLTLPPLARLDQFLAEPDPPVAYRIDRLWTTGARVVLAAQQKAGKSTTVANVLRSLADGGDLFGEYATDPAARVVLLDNEMDERMLRRWLRDQGIAHPERVELVPLRGRLSTFNILEPETRAKWAAHIGAADVLLFDCLRPALDALALDENHDAGRFLEAFDELLTEASISEAMLVHHMGHNGERSRGDSRLLDWPDASWKLVRGDGDDGTAPRYFSANGRDVQEPESRLEYDAATRRLTIAGGSRRQHRSDDALTDLLDLLAREPDQSGRSIEAALEADHGRNLVREALARAKSDGLVTVRQGQSRAQLHSLTEGGAAA